MIRKMKAKFIAIAISFAAVLTACTPVPDYKVDVDLPPEAINLLQEEIVTLEAFIDSAESDGGAADNIKYIQLANAYKTLGDYGQAIAVYEDFIDIGGGSVTIYNNLAFTYQEVEDYDRALEWFELLTEEGEDRYYKEIAMIHYTNSDLERFEEAYAAWQNAFGQKDSMLDSLLRRLQSDDGATE